ncbi:hypothetical protein [Streptomyces arenae]|uniref:hypothetical protein n=1 Tax=Streptomyces arenae TaxID=29301 RepID=UPI00265A3C6A|nr:hypothetical protein [Streptomyces arenae]MCG7209441.1 hypothetical protein [Streptomyces arenae]
MTGRPITDFTDPFALEVHQAIDPPAKDARHLPLLPTYVERAHDGVLRAAAREAAAGSSKMVVLVGDSSTGKTRACWEALRSLPATWRLWHPIDPTRPQAALAELERVGPRTVVWLNESQHYLLTPNSDLGERISAGLRTLLREAQRGPVLVLGTVWPEYWEILVAEPAAGTADRHEQARKLLTGRDLHILTEFNEAELLSARTKAREDPRLGYALERAEDGQITQYLAGAPALLERYRTATRPTRAVIEAAMDARRVGHGVSLPLALLDAAAEGYIPGAQWDLLRDDWLESVLINTNRPLRGTRGPLTRIRDHTGAVAPAQARYRLADYLEQHARTHRRTVRLPASLWNALLDHGSSADRIRLAQAAQSRGLLHVAGQFYEKAAADGSPHAAQHMGDLLARAERDEEAKNWYLYAAGLCDGQAVPRWKGELLLLAGRWKEAVQWYERAVREDPDWDDEEDLAPVGLRLWRAGFPEPALSWIQRGAEAGDREAWRYAAELLHEEGRYDEEISWSKKAVERGHFHFVDHVVRLLEDEGRSDEALTWISSQVAAGVDHAYPHAVRLAHGDQAKEQALALLRERATAGDVRAWGPVAELLGETGRHSESLEAYLRAAESGDREAQRTVVAILTRSGRVAEAVSWLRGRAEAGDREAPQYVGDLLMKQGREREALDVWYQRAADVEYISLRNSYHGAVNALLRAGRPDDAVTWLRVRAEKGHEKAFAQLVRLLEQLGRADEAISRLRVRADAGDKSSSYGLSALLGRLGRLEERVDVCQEFENISTYDLAGSLAAADRTEEALTLYEAMLPHSLGIRGTAARMLAAAHGTDAAVDWLQRCGYVENGVLEEAARILAAADRGAEGASTVKNGWSPDGSLAAPWSIPPPSSPAP